MAEYYKGVVIETSAILEPEKQSVNILKTNGGNCYCSIGNKKFSVCDSKLLDMYQKLVDGTASNEEREPIESEHIGLFKKNLPNKIKEINEQGQTLNNDGTPRNPQLRLNPVSIIYEKVYDPNGNAYAKEIITGLIFPLEDDNILDCDLHFSGGRELVALLDKTTYTVYCETDTGAFFIDTESREVYESYGGYSMSSNIVKYGTEREIVLTNDDNKIYVAVVKEKMFPFTVAVTPKMKDKTKRIEFFVQSDQIANKTEIDDYLKLYRKALLNGKRRHFIEELNKRSSLNCLDELRLSANKDDNGREEPQKIVPKEKLNEQQVVKEVANLELLLARLKSVSEEDYQSLSREYRSIDPNELFNVDGLLLKRIIRLQVSAISRINNVNADNVEIITYLDRQIGDSLNSYRNDIEDNKNSITISGLDELYKNVIKKKSRNPFDQTDILRRIATLYFFELYENRDIITSEELANSYVGENIKRIVTAIYVMLDEGVISVNSNFLFDINNLNLDTLLALIKQIEFNSTDSIGEKGI